MPAAIAKKVGLWNKVMELPKKRQLQVAGLGGMSQIKWIIPDLMIKIGGSTVKQHVGIVDGGEFEILIGNDVTCKIRMNINVIDRTFTYNNPIQGRVQMDFVNDKEIDKLNFNLAILGDQPCVEKEKEKG